MSYQKLLHKLAPGLNPAGVEASMRLQYGSISHLPHEVFAEEAKIAADCERRSPGFLRRTAESFGMGEEFSAWEAKA